MSEAPFNPRIVLDGQTQLALQSLIGPHLGEHNIRRLTRSVKSIIADKFPQFRVTVADRTEPWEREVPLIKMLVTVDGVPDHALIFGRKEPVANDP